MKDEPDIVKELRELERSGKLRSSYKPSFEIPEKEEKIKEPPKKQAQRPKELIKEKKKALKSLPKITHETPKKQKIMEKPINIYEEPLEEKKYYKPKSSTPITYEIVEEKIEEPPKTIAKDPENALKALKNIDLKSFEETYQKIFENYFIGITIADERERIISWNKYAEELLGMNEKDLFLRDISSLYPAEEWKKIRAENIREKGMKYKMETKMFKKSGELLDVELSLCVLKGAHGKLTGSIGIIKDNTKLKATERMLIESEDKYKTIFENSAVAITLTDENERIISWNKYAEELLDMDEAELHLKHVRSLYPLEEWRKIRAENIRQKGMQHHLETKVIKKNGELIDIDISISVLRNHNGEIIGSIGVMKDITEQKKVENELEFKHNLLESLMENIPDSIYFKDKQGKFIKVNKAKSNHANTTPEKMIGKTEYDFFSEEYANKSYENERKVMETGKPINVIEQSIDGKGVERWASITKIPRFDKNGKIIGTMGINRDITEIKKSEKRYRNLFEKAIDPIVVIDKNGFFTDVNDQVLKLLGYRKEELVGKKFYEANILTKKSTVKAIESFKNQMKGKQSPPYEVETITNNGEIIPAEINASAIYENGAIIGDLVILRDLRERYKRRKIEQELFESEKKFRDIFDSTSDFLLYLEKGILLDINVAAINLCGITKKEVIGKDMSILKGIFSEKDLKKHITAINNANKGLDVNDYETELKNKSGTTYEFLFSADCIKDHEEIKGILVRGKDITQRQKAWQELVKLEERYRVLAETSADGVITIDPLGRLTYVNPAFEKMLDRRKSQILATLFRDYLSEDSVYFFQQIFIDARKKSEKMENVELELARNNGETIPIEVNMAPFRKEDEFTGMVCTIRDITERRRVEGELKKSERLKTEFMNIAAHELKSPVTPIKGYLDLILQDEKTSKKIKDWAKVSLRNSERLLRLVDDILDVSRLDTDTMRFEMEKVPIVEVLEEVIEDMKPAVEGKGLKFINNIPWKLPSILGDRHRLAQVFKNLLVNAIKFTDNGSISIKAEKDKNHILISITDTGIGISKNELKKIFNKFYQAYTGDDRKNEGTGLGLFICEEIIEKHKGEIRAESELGKGSTFYIKLPYLNKNTKNVKK
jgi:PAS domain S-box-containing protein